MAATRRTGEVMELMKRLRGTARAEDAGSMEVIDVETNSREIALVLEARELTVLFKALNDVCNRERIEEHEFLKRIGASRDEAREVLTATSIAHRVLKHPPQARP
jgi:hypothetical protein